MSDPIAPPSVRTEPTGAEMSTAETITGVFFEPSRTFEALRARPRFLVAGLILFVLALAVTLVMYSRVDMGQFIRDRIEKSPNAAQVSETQKDTQVKVGKMIGMIFIPLSVPIALAAGAACARAGRPSPSHLRVQCPRPSLHRWWTMTTRAAPPRAADHP